MLLSKVNTFFYVVLLFAVGLCSQPSISADKVVPYFVYDGSPIEVGNFDNELSALSRVLYNNENYASVMLDNIFAQKNKLRFYVTKENVSSNGLGLGMSFIPVIKLSYYVLDDNNAYVGHVNVLTRIVNNQGIIEKLQVPSHIHARKGFGRYLLTRACNFLFLLIFQI